MRDNPLCWFFNLNFLMENSYLSHNISTNRIYFLFIISRMTFKINNQKNKVMFIPPKTNYFILQKIITRILRHQESKTCKIKKESQQGKTRQRNLSFQEFLLQKLCSRKHSNYQNLVFG